MKKKNYLFLLVISAAIAGLLLLTLKEKPRERPHRKPHPSVTAVRKKPVSERPGEQAVPEVPEQAPAAVVAIIIDDMGNDIRQLEEVEALREPVAVAVLPDQRSSSAVAEKARQAGLDVLLHLPMQPREKVAGLGKGALMEGMGPEAIKETLGKDLASVGPVEGVNNHMGSGLTADRQAMLSLMRLLKGRGLFFVDSRTTAASQAYKAAEDEGVKAASRDVFLDDSNDPADIRAQFERLERIALKRGSALAIGHPRPATLAALREELPRLKEKGIRVARVTELVR